MDRLKFLILCAALAAPVAHAGYAQLKPPPGWSQGMGAATPSITQVPGVAGVFNFGAAANSGSMKVKAGTVLTNAALNVAGQLITVPVAMRTAANAASFAAEYSFGNPWLFVGVLAGTAIMSHWDMQDLFIQGQSTDPSNAKWMKNIKSSQEQCTINLNGSIVTAGSCAEALTNDLAITNGKLNNVESVNCPTSLTNNVPCTWTGKRSWFGFSPIFQVATQMASVPGGAPPRPATLPDFSKTDPLSDEAIKALPIPLPIDQPILNPDPALDPAATPYAPRPYFVPTGDPVPTSDPNTFNQPGVRIVPSPTPTDPWRVDIQPQTLPQTSATPKTPDQLNPSTNPANPSPATNPSAKPDTPGLCDQYPNIEACAPAKKEFCEAHPDSLICKDLDVPDETPIPETNKSISVTPDSGWLSGTGSCPASIKLKAGGAEFSYKPYCDFLSGLRPVLIAVAWLSAAFILIGAKGD